MTEEKTYRYCGREFTQREIDRIQSLAFENPAQTRTEFSKRVCELLNWYKPDGGLKDMSCRVALSRMYDDGLVLLPGSRYQPGRKKTYKTQKTKATDPADPVNEPVDRLQDLVFRQVSGQKDSKLWNEYIDRYHYLGYKPLAGAQLRYFVSSQDQLLALLGFGAAAWTIADRDRHIGWTNKQREQNLHLVVNNARFLILPWVQSKNLASKILAKATQRLPGDWLKRYRYQPVLMETFVQQDRYQGVSYKAANWIKVGQTKGRGKLDQDNNARIPIKDIWLYPLHRNFKTILCREQKPADSPSKPS
ncbi:MAG: DUF4338 domain-containing protein [Desulfohalobiaceae bacterium]|nr:DUF4338 domain-containing protein [Desulfohalobiaceae bacterium]